MEMIRFARGTSRLVSGWVVRVVYSLIWLYQRIISPCLPASCRFFPSCSVYAQQALCRHGFWKGSVLTIRRLLRCHPFSSGGIDLVP